MTTTGDDSSADSRPGRQESRALAAALQNLLEGAARRLEDGAASATGQRIAEHLGVELRRTILLTMEIPEWQHVSVQRAAGAYLDELEDPADWFGVLSPHLGHMEFRSLLLHEAGSGAEDVVPPEYGTAADGPSSQLEVIAFGLVLTHSPEGVPVVLAVHRTQMHGPPQLEVVVLAADRAAATSTQERMRALIEELDVIRGQVISFGSSEHYGNALVTFLPRAELRSDQVILEAGVLPRIERHLLLTGRHARRLRASGMHLRRGVLLYGPPGTGKTHIVRYLVSQARESTVIILTGRSLQFIEQAATLARRVAPTIVVVEDVDLIGRDRSFSPDGNPLLFSLLDAMDGVSSDADVTFLLTTNRPADLEEALIQRPGRIDLAVEVPRPGEDSRRRLLQLYAGNATLTAELAGAVARTEGLTASALKELMRRAVLETLIDAAPESGAAPDDPEPDNTAEAPGTDRDQPAPVVTTSILDEALQGYLVDAQELARALADPDHTHEHTEDGPARPGLPPTPQGLPTGGWMSSARRHFPRRYR